MATQEALVQEHGLSLGEANDLVAASKEELGEDATDEMIAAHASDKASAAKADGIAASPTEDTQMSTDTSVETDPSADAPGDEEPIAEEGDDVPAAVGEEEPVAEEQPNPAEELAEESAEPIVDETPKSADPVPAAPVAVAATPKKSPSPSKKAAPKATRGSLRICFFDLGSSDVNVVLDALDELIAINLVRPQIKKKVKAVVDQGAAPMGVLQAMRNHGTQSTASPAVASKCLNVLLALLGAYDKEVMAAMLELDATPLILELMHCHTGPKNVNVQVHGLGLLCSLGEVSKAECTKISENLGVDIIVKDMQEFPKVTTIQRRGAKALYNLATMNPDLKPEMREKEAVSTVGAAMEAYPETGYVFKQASSTMKVFMRP